MAETKKIGLFPMAADVLHAGHMIALEEAKSACDYLIVGLNCIPDGKNPVQSIYERYMQLRAVKFVDEIIPYGGRVDLESLVKSLKYDVRFVGADYIDKDWDGKAWEMQNNKEICYLSRSHEFSSTNLKIRICEASSKKGDAVHC